MSNDKLTILYERLSHEDGRENESLSIEHQKEYLEEFGARNGFTNIVHRTEMKIAYLIQKAETKYRGNRRNKGLSAHWM